MWSEWGRGLGIAEFIGWLWRRRGSIGRSLLAGSQGRGLGGQDFLYLEGGRGLNRSCLFVGCPGGRDLNGHSPLVGCQGGGALPSVGVRISL